MKNKILLGSAFVALFSAIIVAGSFIKIPLGLIPVVIQNILCVLTGVILGEFLAGAPTALFLVTGLIGLPVFSGGTGGIAVLAGPTGGFLLGYLIAAIAAGFIAGRPDVSEKKPGAKTIIRVSLGVFLGMVIVYIPGVFWFSHWALMNSKVPEAKSALSFTMKTCVLPFIPGDLIKTLIAIPVALKIRPLLAQYFYVKADNSEVHQ